MRKTKVYFDASVASMIDDNYEGIITKKFFEFVITSNFYEIILSPVLAEELSRITDKKKESEISQYLESMPSRKIQKNTEAENLAEEYVAEKVLDVKHIQDLRHVAYAVVSHCDYLASWNMKHLSNDRACESLQPR